ncbi:hypothetical protein QJS04_geneDACA001847 [Acorus gramineus]|uniref:Thioesterase domain-containing protein n=1 Tax=Acorus gramineus TaxID=55184 RepID=A0AAV9BI20_ACOGR|nr:hypothetical protein QJS04_geneDACA001847 [Acorus gramineus]
MAEKTDLKAVKDSLERAGDIVNLSDSSTDSLPPQFYQRFIVHGIRVDHIDPGRVVCSLKVPPRLLNTGNFMHGGATASLVDVIGSAAIYAAGYRTSGVSLEISISYLDAAYVGEEIEIEAKVLRVGKAIGVVSVELRKKSGKIIAHARHVKYLAVSSKI